MKKRVLFCILLIGLLFTFNQTKATTYTWSGLGGNTNWNNSGNWLPATGFPNNNSDIANFTTVVAVQPMLNQNISLNQLNISTPTTLTLGAGFSMNVGGGSPQINLTGGLGTITFTGTGTITGNAAITVSNNFTSGSAISATTVTINAFTATFNAALACGSNTITLNAGSTFTTGASGTVTAGALTVAASTATVNSTALQTYGGAITCNGAATFTGTGAIGAQTLTMNSTGSTVNINKTINLSNNATLTNGSININSTNTGTLNVGGSLSTATGTTLLLAGGRMTVTGNMAAAGVLNSTGTSFLTTNGNGNTESGTVDVGGSTGSSLTWNAGASGSSTTVMSNNTTAVHSGSSLIVGANNTLNFQVALQILCNNATSYGVVNSGTIIMNGNNMYSTVAPSSVNALTNNAGALVSLQGSIGRISLGDYTNISNAGTITCSGNSSYISSGQYSVVNNASTGIINVTAYQSYMTMSSTGASVVNSGSIYLSNQSYLNFSGANSFLTNNASGLIDVNGYNVYMQFNAGATNATSGTNAGTINVVQQGALNLQSGSTCTLSNSGTINVGTASLTGGTFNIYSSGAAFTNTNSFIVRNGGVCNIASNNNANTFTNNGGTVTVNGGTFNWGNNGVMTSPSGTIAMSNSATFNLSGTSSSLTNGGTYTVAASTVNLSGTSCSITNSGATSVSAAANIYFSGTSATLSTSGTFNIAGVNSGSYTNVVFNSASTFTNTGTVNASNYSAFNLNHTSATLTNSGPFGLASSTILLFGGGATLNNNTAAGVLTVSGGGSITTTTGPINNTLGTITLNVGSLVINSSGTLTSSGTFTVASGSTFNMSGGTSRFINSGAFSMTSATFTAGNDVTFTNSGTSSTMVITNTDLPFTGNNPNITNQGTMTVTGYTTSGSGFRQAGAGIFNNTGTVNFNSTIYSTTNPVTMTNASGANFNLSATTFTLGSNTCILNNVGTFTANNNSIVTVSGYQAKIANSGTFYAGTSNSKCTLRILTQPIDQNTNASFYNTGTAYVGSTSLVSFVGCNYQATLNNAGRFVFQSDANGSAALDDMVTSTNNPSIRGSYDIERFFTGGGLSSNRGYRLLSSPVNQNSATVSATNTFNLLYLNQHTYNGVSYPGIFTGGVAGTSAGFSGTSNQPTIYLFKETIAASNTTNYSGKHVAIVQINATSVNTSNSADPSAVISNLTIPIGNGFLAYFAGPSSRTSGTSTIPPLDATMTANGYLNYGNFTVNLWYTPSGGTGYLSYAAAGAASLKGFNMVGNPYPSTLDFNKLYTDNSANIDVIYMLSQRAGGTSQDYVAYSTSGSSSPAINNYAVSGAGFIVHVKSTAGTTATLQFRESQKAATQQVTGSSLIMSAPKSEVLAVDGKLGANSLSAAQQRTMAIQLPSASSQPITGLYMKMEKDSSTFSYCGIYYREGYAAKYEDGDAPYLASAATAAVTMASRTSDGVNTAINHLPDYHGGSRVWLNAGASANGLYHLKLEGVRNIDTLYDIYLMDHFKKDSLDIRRYGSYAFNINKSDSTTFGAKRFELVIRRRPLPQYLLTDFSGSKVTQGVNIGWKTVNESNYTGFVLEKKNKTTGQFIPIYEKQSDGSSAYGFIDREPYSGNNVYRLKQDDVDDKISYSQDVVIFYDKNAAAGNGLISVFPNPTVEMINVSVPETKAAAAYKFMLYNASGNLVMQKTSNTSNWSQNVSGLKTGAYIVEVLKNDGTPLGKTKFIKN